ncbi:hypothetical protein CPT_Premi_056 [Proteus phage Premi]|uniref:Uncharacterized protein n=1 Tax=Proteus phage Premi TaxID=3097470 RepID=A0ABZ1A1F7_9CAUD|nr:hypothetical protein CPT_Premi_056 [Proteus phage Premi]
MFPLCILLFITLYCLLPASYLIASYKLACVLTKVTLSNTKYITKVTLCCLYVVY